MTAQPEAHEPVSAAVEGRYGVIVRSIGDAGAGVVAALRQISPLPESVLAARLFQAPSLLFQRLSREIATAAIDALEGAGLECALYEKGESFTPGRGDHEVALVVRDVSRTGAVLGAMMELLGVDANEARRILGTTPTVLLGQISSATVEALRRRFEPLGVALDVSRPSAARYDVFVGERSAAERAALRDILARLGIPELRGDDGGPQPMLAVDLSFDDAERLWEAVRRGQQTATILNRDFLRFDLRLDAAVPSPELTEFLVDTAGMPAQIVPKLLKRLPMVTHPCVRWDDLCAYIGRIAELGGEASGHLLAFQAFSLKLREVGDRAATLRLLRALAGLSAESAEASLAAGVVDAPLSGVIARWLAHELKKVGTTAGLVLR
ncbi:MAG: hypothetical protein KC486_05240 [Myxococcales bacterium]|nr:hypothetical protein [Myxococcales bacterium]